MVRGPVDKCSLAIFVFKVLVREMVDKIIIFQGKTQPLLSVFLLELHQTNSVVGSYLCFQVEAWWFSSTCLGGDGSRRKRRLHLPIVYHQNSVRDPSGCV